MDPITNIAIKQLISIAGDRKNRNNTEAFRKAFKATSQLVNTVLCVIQFRLKLVDS